MASAGSDGASPSRIRARNRAPGLAFCFWEGEAGVMKEPRFELKLDFPETPVFGALLAMDRKEPSQEPDHGSSNRSRMDRSIIFQSTAASPRPAFSRKSRALESQVYG